MRALARRFVPVLVQRQLTDNGVFTERFRARSRINWLREGEAEVDVLAMLEDDAELAQELLPTQSRPLTHLLTAEASVAALVGAVTKQAVLVHWWLSGALRTLGVREGRVVWQRMQPMDVQLFSDPQQWKMLLDTATSTAPLEFSGSHGQVLRMGKGPWAASGEWAVNGSRELVNRIGGLLQGVDVSVVLLQPDLYGLAFANASDTLIVNGYRQRVMAWRWAPTVSGLACAAGALLLGAGLWWQNQADEDAQLLRLEQASLAAEAQNLEKMKPPTEAVAALRAAAWRETALGANLRVDRFLNELLASIPAGVQVKELRIQRNGAAAERVRLSDGQPVQQAQANRAPRQLAQRQEVASPLLPTTSPQFTAASPTRRMPVEGEPSFQVELNILLPGGYANAKLKAEALAEKLTLLGRLSDTRLTFEDKAPDAPGARLKTRLTIAAGAF